jgi:hypothetical protein
MQIRFVRVLTLRAREKYTCYGHEDRDNRVLNEMGNPGDTGIEQKKRILIRVRGDTVVEAFTAAAEAVLSAANNHEEVRTPSDRFLPFRAEAGDLPLLLPAVIDAIFDELGNIAMPASVTMDGFVRSDSGCVAWGVIELAGEASSRTPTVSFERIPSVFEAPGSVEIDAVIHVDH